MPAEVGCFVFGCGGCTLFILGTGVGIGVRKVAVWVERLWSGEAVSTSTQRFPVGEPANFEGVTGACSGVHELKEGCIVEYFTDVEGNWLYFRQFVNMSKILYWDESENQGLWAPGTLKLRDNGVLVFGGDSVDKGQGDIRIVKNLLHLKKTHWDQVFIILGNRDINKLRFYAELHIGEDATHFEKHGGAYWIQNPAQYKKYDDYLAEKKLERDHVSTLKWMLDCNMGCQNTTFRMRRHELTMFGFGSTDEDVVRSFRSSVDPKCSDSWMLDLLRVGQLAVLLGDILFVHAGLCDKSVGWVPGEQTRRRSVKEWVTALNTWKDTQLKDFMDRPAWRKESGGPGGGRRRGGEHLIDYGVPNGCGGVSVVYHNPFKNGNPQTFSKEVEDFLRDSGVRRVISGHQPHGDSPAVVRHVRTGLLAIMCDTSYSSPLANKAINESNMRGDVCCVLRMDRSSVTLEGRLSDNTEHKCTLHSEWDLREFEFVESLGSIVKLKRERNDINLYIDGHWEDEIKNFKICKERREFTFGQYTGCFHQDENSEKIANLCKALFQPEESNMCDMDCLKNELVGRQLRDGSWVKTITKQGEVIAALGVGFNVFVRRMHVVNARLLLKPKFSNARIAASLHDLTGETQEMILGNQLAPPAEPSARDLTRSVSFESKTSEIDARLFHKMETFIFDGQGTLWSAQAELLRTTEKVNELISHTDKKVMFASNRTESRVRLLDKLRDGMKVNVGRIPFHETLSKSAAKNLAKDHIITAGFVCARYLKRSGVKRPLVFCSSVGLLEELEDMGIKDYATTITKDGEPMAEFNQPMDSQRVQDLVQQIGKIDAIVVGWDQCFTALKIAVAASYLKWSQEDPIDGQSLRFVVCSSDPSSILGVTSSDFQPTHVESGLWAGCKIPGLGTGTMGQSICICAGLPMSHGIHTGKPSYIFSEALMAPKSEDGYGVKLKTAVVIGDTLTTDIELANRHGMSSVLVLSGVTSKQDLEREENVMRLPQWVCESVADIPPEPPPSPSKKVTKQLTTASTRSLM